MTSGLDRLCEAVEAAEAAAESARRQEGFMCPHPGCARVFSKRYNQQAHMRLHDGTRPFSCPRCNKDFMWKSSLKSHAKMHDKMDAAAAALAAKRAAHPTSATVSTSAMRSSHQKHQPAAAKAVVKQHSKRVAKRQGKTTASSQSRKVARHSSKTAANAALGSKAAAASAHASISANALTPTLSMHRPAGSGSRSHHVSSPQTRPSTKPKAPVGRQSPDSVTRTDLETATLLTMIR